MKCTFNGRKRIPVANFSPFLRENIFTLTQNSVPQSENILPQTDRFLPIHFFVHVKILRQRENIIRFADNIYPPTDSNLPLMELYNYAPLIGHEFSHKRSPIQSPIEGIRRRL